MLNRTIRKKHPGEESITLKVHNKEIKILNTKIIKSNDAISVLKNKLLNQNIIHNNILNRTRKRVAYWKGLCKDLRGAVHNWRNVENSRNGFVAIEEEESIKWFKFYTFIDELIEIEYGDDVEMSALHKELIRSELNTLGKFNKSKNKRGINKTKISTRILNYALGLADSLGKVKYESEAIIRSLPAWSTLSRYIIY